MGGRMVTSLPPGRAPDPAVEVRMLRYAPLSGHPAAFLAATGLGVAEFDALLGDVLPRLPLPDRRRALEPRDQVLLAAVWLRLYPTGSALGDLFGVSESTARRTHQRVVPVLAAA